jgi:hypothetical protein
MAIAKHFSAFHSTALIRIISFTAVFVMPSLFMAQTAAPPKDELTSTVDSVSLPDAPTPTDVVLAVNGLPFPDIDFSSADLEQQASQSILVPHPQHPKQTPSTSAPSLADLGLTPAQTKPDPDMQARLDRRTHMLKVHQQLGLYTVIPIAAACISGAGAVPDRNTYGDTTSRDVHVAIAGVAISMYAATAYAIRAPRIPDGPTCGGIKIHKYLIWIHAPEWFSPPFSAPWPSTISPADISPPASRNTIPPSP